jgi:hypothetical protein
MNNGTKNTWNEIVCILRIHELKLSVHRAHVESNLSHTENSQNLRHFTSIGTMHIRISYRMKLFAWVYVE